SKGKVFLNTNDKKQVEQSTGIENISFNNELIKFIEADPFVKVKFDNSIIKSCLVGKYNYTNIAVAISIGNYFNVSTENIKNAIETYTPTNNRSQIILKGTNKIILDAYNANPSSMEAALENFDQLQDSRKSVFLGDMFELGSKSAEEHQKIAHLASSLNFENTYLIGKAFSTTSVKNAFIFDSFESFKNSKNYLNIKENTILIKGSRGMALERILDLF
ncbi:MAG: glutamate ligase domain-containing protein, partial [Cellulophaga baltica]